MFICFSFLGSCKNFAKIEKFAILLFWVWLAMPTMHAYHAWACRDVFCCLSASKKKQLYPSLLSWDMQRYFQLVILGTLGISSYDHQKRLYQLLKNFGVYLYAKNQLYLSNLSWHIALILEICYFGYLRHVWPTPPKPLRLTYGKL